MTTLQHAEEIESKDMQPFEIDGQDARIRQFFGKALTTPVEAYEDCGGGLHLWQEGRQYVIGGVSASGSFADDAESLANGGVYADSWQGQTAYDPAELVAAEQASANATVKIAEYNPITKEVTIFSGAGNAGYEYLGLSE